MVKSYLRYEPALSFGVIVSVEETLHTTAQGSTCSHRRSRRSLLLPLLLAVVPLSLSLLSHPRLLPPLW
uniref:Uncharacterized protein n=1 Tax=Salix viminalis TaxID=40686 RepID=A0A6N2K6K6_SALVM